MNKLKNILNSIKSFVLSHKLWTIFGVVIIGIGAYYLFKPSPPMQFEYMTVEAKTLKTSVEGSGSVSTQSQVELKSTASGKITQVYVKSGQKVKEGQSIITIDASDAMKEFRRASIDLETAKLELEKFKKGPTTVDIQILEGQIAKAEQSKKDADKDVAEAYKNLLNTSTVAVSSFANDTRTPPTITGKYNGDKEVVLYVNLYGTGNGLYFSSYSVPSEPTLNGTGIVDSSIPKPIGESGLYIKFATTETGTGNWIVTLPNKTATSYASDLKIYKDTLTARDDTIRDADITIAENKQKINNLYQPDTLEIRTKELVIQQKEDALTNARIELAKYTIKAPFAGTIGSIKTVKYEWLSDNTTVAVLSTDKNVAEINLNEVDATNISIGQKAELTFDALPDLTLLGTVSEIDSVGIETSNVVTFKVKVVFDQEDARIRPGMGVTANIITSVKENILLVPNGSIKNENGQNYVEVKNISTGKNDRVNITIGVSNDTDTEVVSGLTSGQEVVVRQIVDTATGGSLF